MRLIWKDDKFRIEGFKSLTENWKTGVMGGIATCMSVKFVAEALKVTGGSSEEFPETFWTCDKHYSLIWFTGI